MSKFPSTQTCCWSTKKGQHNLNCPKKHPSFKVVQTATIRIEIDPDVWEYGFGAPFPRSERLRREAVTGFAEKAVQTILDEYARDYEQSDYLPEPKE